MSQNKLKLFDLVSIGVGSIIGAGIFSMLMMGLSMTGRSIALALAFAMLVVFLQGIKSLFLSSMFALEGGMYAQQALILPPIFTGTTAITYVVSNMSMSVFGISIAYPGRLNPWYTYGAIAVAIPGWGLGTFFGAAAGSVLPLRLVSALSVGLYGMFLAIIIPPARESRVVRGLVLLSFAASFIAGRWSLLSGISSGVRTIFLTVVISLGAAILFPRRDEEQTEGEA